MSIAPSTQLQTLDSSEPTNVVVLSSQLETMMQTTPIPEAPVSGLDVVKPSVLEVAAPVPEDTVHSQHRSRVATSAAPVSNTFLPGVITHSQEHNNPQGNCYVAEIFREVEVTEPFLQELTPVDRLFVTKRLHVKSVLFLRGKRNKFFIRTPDENLLYTVEEENSWWVGYFCYGLRPLQLRVTNGEGTEVMRINRPYACTARVMPCQMQSIQVFAPPGNLIGSIEQQWAYVRPIYLVKDAEGVDMLWIRGPYYTVSFFKDIQFQITQLDGTPVGATCKRWQGLAHAMFRAPVTDRFGVAFNKDLTVQQKALLLAATLLLDYMYYDV